MAISQATTADLTSRSLRPLTTAETTWATVRLRDAFTQIIAALPSLGARLDSGVVSDPINQLVIQVQCSMVLRVLSNPDGVLEETIDDYTRRLDAAISTGALYLTDLERSLLSATVGSSEGAFTIRPYGIPDRGLFLFPPYGTTL
jgi:hypothetical protein